MTENSAGPAMTDGLTNKVRVSATAKPLVFYVNLAKKIAESSGTVEISGLGIATPSVATISEILRNRHEFHVQSIQTDMVEFNDTDRPSSTKPKLTVVMTH